MDDDLVRQLRGWEMTERMSDDARRKVWLMIKAADEIERLREYGEKMRQVCIQLSEEIHRLDPSRPVPETLST